LVFELGEGKRGPQINPNTKIYGRVTIFAISENPKFGFSDHFLSVHGTNFVYVDKNYRTLSFYKMLA